MFFLAGSWIKFEFFSCLGISPFEELYLFFKHNFFLPCYDKVWGVHFLQVYVMKITASCNSLTQNYAEDPSILCFF